jgi:hypothetical protein
MDTERDSVKRPARIFEIFFGMTLTLVDVWFTGFRQLWQLSCSTQCPLRESVGNLTFNDRGTCIGSEPVRHQRVRRKRAEEQRKKREQKKEEMKEIDAN